MLPTAVSNSAASLCIAALRSAAACSSAAELVGERALLGDALLLRRARLGLVLLGLQPLHLHQVVAEGVGGARGVADLVAARGEGNLDRLVAVGELEQQRRRSC